MPLNRIVALSKRPCDGPFGRLSELFGLIFESSVLAYLDCILELKPKDEKVVGKKMSGPPLMVDAGWSHVGTDIHVGCGADVRMIRWTCCRWKTVSG
jgi:hypothetical protein